VRHATVVHLILAAQRSNLQDPRSPFWSHVRSIILDYPSLEPQLRRHIPEAKDDGFDQALRNTAFQRIEPRHGLDDMVLAPETQKSLRSVVDERQAAERLAEHGLAPPRLLLFHGAPGTGKTMAAGAIAKALGLPCAVASIEHVWKEGFMGAGANNVSKMFGAVRSTPGVYLLDEADALVSRRSPERPESGAMLERNATTNTLLKHLEDVGPSLVILATNLAKGLDDAIWRRIDLAVGFQGATAEQAAELVARRLGAFHVAGYDAQRIAYAGLAMGHADIAAGVESAMRAAIVAREPLTCDALIGAIGARRRSQTENAP